MKYWFLILIITLPSVYSAITLDKKIYDINEIVKIRLNDTASSINIVSNQKNYQYLDVKSTLLFKPSAPGRYHIVGDGLMQEAQFIVSSDFWVHDSKGESYDYLLRIQEKDKVYTKKISQLNANDYTELYDVEINPGMIKKIRFKDLRLNKFKLGIEELKLNSFVKSYAIDPSELDFDSAVVTSTAVGEELYKCAQWNFSEQKCYGQWKKIMDIVPGKDYSFVLTKDDPGYGESGTVPEPHPVYGYVFYADKTGADNGIPVKIINNNRSNFILTEVYAPPIPSYKGTYSADIYGIDGDSITVRAWNDTHYGQTNAVLESTSTQVNVTLSNLRGSEPNVTILYPENDTSFNTNDVFNVTAKVQILANDAINCKATLQLNEIAQLFPDENYTLNLGDINQNDFAIVSWNLTATSHGTTNITVNVSCDTDTIVLDLDSATAYNISTLDLIAPSVFNVYPSNNSEMTNPLSLIFNVSDHTGIENCSLYLNSQLNQTLYNLDNGQHRFNFTFSPDNYEWYITCFDSSPYNNVNSSIPWTFLIPSWQFYYGNLSIDLTLSNSENLPKYKWDTEAVANIYVVETGSNIDWSALQALGRNISNRTSGQDFYEADLNLSMTTFSDSINTTFTYNNNPKKTTTILSYDRLIKNVPIVNSTNTSNFFTGILWDTSDGNSEYNGTQDLVFLTQNNQSEGKFGIYDYEIRIPASLKNYKLGAGSVTFFIEVI